MSLFAGALRYYSALDNLWMDEIWSWNFAQTMHSPLDVFRVTHIDFQSENTINNHILNTLYLYYFGGGQWWPRYRLFSIIAGVASVALLGLLGFQRNFFAGIASMIFGSLSMPLITYSSEARGYSPAIFFSLATLLAFQKYGKAKTKLLPVFFWLSVILGFLAHYLFFVVFAAFFISSLYQTFKDAWAAGRWKMLAVWYAVPSVFAVFFYYFFIKILSNYGGDVASPGIERFSLFMVPLLNLPYGNIFSASLAFIIFVSIAAWLYSVERRRSKEWLFYFIICVIFPFIIFFAPLPYFSPRYLSLSIPFICLLSGFMLSEFFNLGKEKSITAIFIVLMFVILSAFTIKNELKFGRGDYLNALSYIYKETNDQNITLASDHDFRNPILIVFYEKFLVPEKNFYYYYASEKNADPEWVITHSLEPDYRATPKIERTDGKIYDLQRSFPHSNMFSGWSWFVYRKQ